MLLEKIIQTSKVQIWRNLAYIRCYSGRKIENDDFDSVDQTQQWNYDSADEIATTNTETRKLIKVAIIGVPNAGKSTLINELVDHRVSLVFNSSDSFITHRCVSFRFVLCPAKFIQLATILVQLPTTKTRR